MRKAVKRARGDAHPYNAISLPLTEFSELLAAIYEGPLEAVPWKSALDLLRRHLRASYVTLMLQPPSAEREALMVNSAGDLPITREAEYNKHYYALDPFVDLPPDRVVTVNELIGDANWRESEFYKQFLKPLDILHALGADIRTEDGLECRLRVARPHREPPFSEHDKALCTAVLPHLKRAVRLHSQLEMVDSERRLYAGTVDRMLVGTVTLDETGAVLTSNPVADEMLRKGDGLRQVNGVLRADAAAENRELQRLVKQALSGETGGRAGGRRCDFDHAQIGARQARSAGAQHPADGMVEGQATAVGGAFHSRRRAQIRSVARDGAPIVRSDSRRSVARTRAGQRPDTRRSGRHTQHPQEHRPRASAIDLFEDRRNPANDTRARTY